MNINIFGVGRSGTTVLYELLQKAMMTRFGAGDVRFFYEPFLRDNRRFQQLYSEQKNRFGTIDSLSMDGMHYHVELPMLITEAQAFKENAFLSKIYAADGTDRVQHRLIKYIRANGRYRLIESICPECRSIFVMRNPLDVANSVKDRFSFYGGEFHKDDQARFIDEVNRHYGTSYAKGGFENYIDEQLFYWYYMNRFALESFRDVKNKPLIVTYESFQKHPEAVLQEICRFTGLDYTQELGRSARKPVGSLTESRVMSRADFAVAEKYLEKYFVLLDEFGLECPLAKETITAGYAVTDAPAAQLDPYYGLHSRAIAKKVAKERKQEAAAKRTPPAKVTFAHIVNPVIVPESSDLFRAQPVTFQTMQTARALAEIEGIGVEQLAAFFPEDEALVPEQMIKTPCLERSVLDMGSFGKQKKLPMLADILERADAHSDAEYVIYTNADIALMPHFYLTAAHIMQKGYDAVNIVRRTLDDKYSGVDDIPDMYSDFGTNHPGSDCFIIKKELLRKIDLQKVVIGSEFVAFALRFNLKVFANNMAEFRRLHMTFHIGDDRVWESLDDFAAFNVGQIETILRNLDGRDDIVHPEALEEFHMRFLRRQQHWKARGDKQ